MGVGRAWCAKEFAGRVVVSYLVFVVLRFVRVVSEVVSTMVGRSSVGVELALKVWINACGSESGVIAGSVKVNFLAVRATFGVTVNRGRVRLDRVVWMEIVFVGVPVV